MKLAGVVLFIISSLYLLQIICTVFFIRHDIRVRLAYEAGMIDWVSMIVKVLGSLGLGLVLFNY